MEPKRFKQCLNFILNEYTTKVSFNCQCYMESEISYEVTSHIFSKCKALRELDLHHSLLNEVHFLNSISKYKCLMKLNLSSTLCTDRMVMKIWDTLPDLEELNLSFCSKLTKKCLLYLCKNKSNNSDMYPLCRQHGFCRKKMNKLKVLDIDRTSVLTHTPITCALKHLQSLEYFICSFLYEPHCYIQEAIHALKYASIKRRQPFFPLKLKHMEFGYEVPSLTIWNILSEYTHLEKLTFFASTENLATLATRNYTGSINSIFIIFPNTYTIDSVEFESFLLKWSDRLETLAISLHHHSGFQMRHIVKMFTKCKNLKEFRVVNRRIENEAHDSIANVQGALRKLQVLDLRGVFHFDLSPETQALFSDLLNQMVNLEILKVSSFIAENLLPKALEMSNLSNLQKIVIYHANMGKVLLESFINKKNNLKEIVLFSCSNAELFLKMNKDIAEKNNCFLNTKCTRRSLGSYYSWSQELLYGNECCRFR